MNQLILDLRFLCVVLTALLASVSGNAKTVHYELTATRQLVNLSGKKTVDFAIAVNGTIPAPTLEFTEGDDAEIVVKNAGWISQTWDTTLFLSMEKEIPN